MHLLSEPWGAAYQLVCLFPVCSQIQIVRAVQVVLLYVNSFYVLSTVSACEENAENTRWTPWGGEILKLSPMVRADPIVMGAADRLPDVVGK